MPDLLYFSGAGFVNTSTGMVETAPLHKYEFVSYTVTLPEPATPAASTIIAFVLKSNVFVPTAGSTVQGKVILL